MWIRKFEFLANTSNLLIERIKPCIQLCYITFHSLYLNEFQKSFHSKNEFFSLIILSELNNYVLMDKNLTFFLPKKFKFYNSPPPYLLFSYGTVNSKRKVCPRC